MNEETIKMLLEQHENKLTILSNKIDLVEAKQIELNIRIDNLCQSINELTNSIKWLMRGFIVTFVGFFMFIIQNNLF